MEADRLTVGIAVALLCRAPTVLPAAMAVAALADRGVDSVDRAAALVAAGSMAEVSVVAASMAAVAEDSTAVVAAVIANRYRETDRDNGPL